MTFSFETTDLTPRFLAFYAGAEHETEPERRWALWREHYGFAAVPPTPAGEGIARQLLDGAWERYGEALPLIRRGAGELFTDAEVQLGRVRVLLGVHDCNSLHLVGYVGGFEHNAFSAGQGGVLSVCLPIEMPRDLRLPVLAHELTHALHLTASGSSGAWHRPLAESILQEGLATRVTQALFPHAPLAQQLGEPEWYRACEARERELLQAIRPFLNDDSDATTLRFVLGPGGVNLPREAYYAGWVLVGDLLSQGRTLAELAHLPHGDAVPLIHVALGARLGRA